MAVTKSEMESVLNFVSGSVNFESVGQWVGSSVSKLSVVGWSVVGGSVDLIKPFQNN